jgi:hypothetical protein
MALEGTLADFGIGEILQLIGSQQKTGILFVEGTGETEEVQVFFRGGKVIRCDVARRDKRDLIGNMLAAAMVISREQLSAALETQKKTLKRVGDILVEEATITPEILQEFTDLQTRETLARLFQWKKGKYRFESKPPGFARPNISPIACENLLMEGVRMMDEWPLIQTRINNPDTVFKAIKTIEESETEAEALDRILDDAFSEFVDATSPPVEQTQGRGKKATGAASNLSRSDRRVFAYVDGKRTVVQIIDLSRLGEFEACKSLLSLLNEGYIAPIKVTAPRTGDTLRRRVDWGRMALKVALNLAVLGLLGLLVWFMPQSRAQLTDNSAEFGRETMGRLRANRILTTTAALETWRLREGSYPERLDALVNGGLLIPEIIAPPGQPPLEYFSIGVDFDLR